MVHFLKLFQWKSWLVVFVFHFSTVPYLSALNYLIVFHLSPHTLKPFHFLSKCFKCLLSPHTIFQTICMSVTYWPPLKWFPPFFRPAIHQIPLLSLLAHLSSAHLLLSLFSISPGILCSAMSFSPLWPPLHPLSLDTTQKISACLVSCIYFICAELWSHPADTKQCHSNILKVWSEYRLEQGSLSVITMVPNYFTCLSCTKWDL